MGNRPQSALNDVIFYTFIIHWILISPINQYMEYIIKLTVINNMPKSLKTIQIANLTAQQAAVSESARANRKNRLASAQGSAGFVINIQSRPH